jgi:glutamate/tyrosine decarboxylase-like PLP-dependent enzyme
MIERTCSHADSLVRTIGSLPGAEIVWTPQINQGLVRFLSPLHEATQLDHDAFTDRIMAKILASGQGFFTGTTWRGRRAMRVSVCNWQTPLNRILATRPATQTIGWTRKGDHRRSFGASFGQLAPTESHSRPTGGPRGSHHRDRHTRHEVAALRVGGPSGRT